MSKADTVRAFVESKDFITISPSQLSVWLSCEEQWYWAYPAALTKKEKKAKHLNIGIYVHDLMHIYYQLIQQGVEPGSEYAMEFMRDRIHEDLSNDEQGLDLIAIVAPLIVNYISTRSPEIDQGMEVLGVEQEVLYDLGIEVLGKKVYLHGFIDLLYRQHKVLKVRDHKTGANAASHTEAKVRCNHQLMTYGIATGAEVLEISFINSNPPKKENSKTPKYLRHQVPLNTTMVEPWLENIRTQVIRMYSQEPTKRWIAECGNCQFELLCRQELMRKPIETTVQAFYKPKPKAIRLPVTVNEEKEDDFWVF